MFIKQNQHHKHGVLLHTLKVVYHVFQRKLYRMIGAAFLHDISKPFIAYQKPEDIPKNEYSFTDHEHFSYEMIHKLPGISEYTKIIVKNHYLLRDMSKSLKKNKIEHHRKRKKIWDNLDEAIRQDLILFQKCDDAGK
jgi:hypothetical protein